MDKNYLLVDIDGTISDASKRAETYLEGDPPDWDDFYAACGEDAPITPIIPVIESLAVRMADHCIPTLTQSHPPVSFSKH